MHNYLLQLVFILLLGCSTLNSKNRGLASQKEDEVSFIFTSHSMLPNAEKELEEILGSLNPDSIFIEISPENLQSNKIDGYPLEMVFAMKWAKKNSKSVYGFDCSIDTKMDGMPDETRKAIIAQYLEYRKGRSWRDLNDPEVAHHGISITQATHDPEKLNQRRTCMQQNILRLLPKGRTIVLTGGFHSEFFRNKFKEAVFPLTPDQ